MNPVLAGVTILVVGGVILYELEKNVLQGTMSQLLGGTFGTGSSAGLPPAAAAGNPISVANYNKAVTAVGTFGYHPVSA